MRNFGTQDPVNPEVNYVVSRTDEIADFIDRVKIGIVGVKNITQLNYDTGTGEDGPPYCP